jgi:hypothetical protein
LVTNKTHLNRSTLPAGHLIGATAPETTGIVGVANRSHLVTDAMASPDFLYSVVTLDPGKEEVGVVDVHRRILVAAEDAAEVLEAIRRPTAKDCDADDLRGRLPPGRPHRTARDFLTPGGSSTVATTIRIQASPPTSASRSTSATPPVPGQRGSNENTNGLLRQYFPKSIDLSRRTPGDLARVGQELNTRPRMILADRTPAELFEELLASQNHPLLR